MTRTEGRNAYLDHIEHGDKLREHEHLVSSFKKGFEEPLENHHLPTSIDKVLVHDGAAASADREASQTGKGASTLCVTASRRSEDACF